MLKKILFLIRSGSEEPARPGGGKKNPVLRFLSGVWGRLIAAVTILASVVTLGKDYKVLLGWVSSSRPLFSTILDIIGKGVLSPFGMFIVVFGLLSLAFLGFEKRRKGSPATFRVGGTLKDGYFRLDPYGEGERERFQRPDGAAEKVYEWIRSTEEPLLLLTGRSGSGKSSLLQASAIPKLRECTDPVFCVISVRCYSDPSSRLLEALRQPEAVWRRPPEGDLRYLLERAVVYLRQKRLLVVLDQFDEFLVFNGRNEQNGFVKLLRSLHEDPISGLCVLISVRSEFLEPSLGLVWEGLGSQEKFIRVEPFTEMAARTFLEESGLDLEKEHLDDLILEATKVEGSQGEICPFLLNFLGLAIAKKGSRRLRSGYVVSDHLKEALEAKELRGFSRPILQSFINEGGSKEPRMIEEIAIRESMDILKIGSALLKLGDLGLVRELDPDLELWEISHSFVAPLLSPIFDETRTFRGYSPRPLLYGALGAAIFSIVVNWPLIQMPLGGQPGSAENDRRNSAIEEIEHLGFSVEKVGKFYFVQFVGGKVVPDLKSVVGHLGSVDGYVSLDLTQSRVVGLEPLEDLVALHSLNLTNTSVVDLEPLQGMSSLQSLSLANTRVSDLRPIRKLALLQSLNLANTGVVELDPLSNLSLLKVLNLSNTSVANVSPLKNLSSLLEVDLRNTQVADLGPLREVSSLESLTLEGTRVFDLEPLSKLLELRKLNLSFTEVSDLAPLGELSNLRGLHVEGTRVFDLEPLRGLLELQELTLSNTEVSDLAPLGELLNLRDLHIDGAQVVDLKPIGKLLKLRSLYVSVPSKAELTHLNHLKNLEIQPVL